MEQAVLTFHLVSHHRRAISYVFSFQGENFTRGLDSKDLMKHNSENKFARKGFCCENPKGNMLFIHKEQLKKIYREKGNVKIRRKIKKSICRGQGRRKI